MLNNFFSGIVTIVQAELEKVKIGINDLNSYASDHGVADSMNDALSRLVSATEDLDSFIKDGEAHKGKHLNDLAEEFTGVMNMLWVASQGFPVRLFSSPSLQPHAPHVLPITQQIEVSVKTITRSLFCE